MILHIDKKTLSALLAAGCLLGAPNRRPHDHIGQFNFGCELQGVMVGAFKNVEGLDAETEVVEYLNDPIVRYVPGKVIKVGRLVCTNLSGKKDVFLNWRMSVLSGAPEKKDGSIVLFDDEGAPVGRYSFSGAWPCKWKGWDLDGKGGDVTAEEIELAVEKIERG